MRVTESHILRKDNGNPCTIVVRLEVTKTQRRLNNYSDYNTSATPRTMDRIQKINRDYYSKKALAWTTAKTHSFYSEHEFRKFVHYLKDGTSVLDI